MVTPPSQHSCSEQRTLGGGVAGGPGRRRGKPVGRYRLVDCWSRAEWERRPAWARPEGAVPFGDCWLLLTEESPDGSSGTRAEPPASEPGGESRTDGSHRGGGVMPRSRRRADRSLPGGDSQRPRPAPRGPRAVRRPRGAVRRRDSRPSRRPVGQRQEHPRPRDAVRPMGTRLELEARGPDAEAALAALAELVSARFHEVE